MNIKSRKGFALAIAIFFLILSAITSVGMYAYGYFITREAGIQEKSSIRGYYLGIAAVRYASILLGDPVGNFGFTTAAHNGDTRTINIHSDSRFSAFKSDIGLAAGETLSITATEWSAGCDWTQDNYRVSATYNST